MKILVANPNRSEPVTGVIERSARSKIVNPNTEILIMRNYRGTKGIDCILSDYQSSWSIMREIIKKVESEKIDAVVVAGFGNLGIYALKEALSIPTLSMSETSMTVAAMLGHKFTVLTTMRNNIPLLEDLVRLYRLENKCASVRGIDVNVEECVTHREQAMKKLSEEIVTIVEQDNAELVILGSAGLCGYNEDLQELANIPVLDPVAVTVKMAEMMVETGLSHSKKRKFANPPQELSNYFWDGE